MDFGLVGEGKSEEYEGGRWGKGGRLKGGVGDEREEDKGFGEWKGEVGNRKEKDRVCGKVSGGRNGKEGSKGRGVAGEEVGGRQ